MKKLLFGLTLLFGSVYCNANNKVVDFGLKKETTTFSMATKFSTPKSEFQYKKYRKTRSDKGKKRGTYKKRR